MSELEDLQSPTVSTATLERAVIGALITESSVLRSVQTEVMPSDFEDPHLGAIYRGMIGMVASGVPIDLVTVADHLQGWNVPTVQVTQLAAWQSWMGTPQSANYYARKIRERSMTRRMRVTAERMIANPDPTIALARALEELRELQTLGGSEAAVAPRWLDEILAASPSEDAYDWTVRGLLERRDRLMLTGSEGGGKSTLLRQIAVMVASGVHPFDATLQVEPMRVLVVDVENSERQWRRKVRSLAANAAAVGRADPRQYLAVEFLRSMDITRPSDQGNVHRWIDQVKPDILLIGPLYKMVPRAIKDDDDAAPVLAALDAIRDHGDLTMLIEAHAGHGDSRTGVRDLRPRGSSALLGWPEFGLGVGRPDKVGDPFRLVRWRGDRDERNWPTHLMSQKYNRQRWPWEPAAGYYVESDPAADTII